MKTRNFIQLTVIAVTALTFAFTSCKKDDLSSGQSDPASIVQLTTDENNVDGIMNDAASDVESLLSLGSGFKSSEVWRPCHGTVDSTSIVNDTITFYITYDGLNCRGNLIWTGKIEIKRKVGVRWYQPGAAVVFKYINLNVTRVNSNKSITLNGTKTFTNVNGGLRWQVGTLITSYVETVRGSMQASFENETSRTWNVARKFTYTGTQGHLVMTVDGFGSADGTNGGYTNLVVWGTNRQGETFYTQITQSIVHKQVCDFKPCSGIKIHQIPSKNMSATVTFGYDDNNQPVQGDACPTKFRVDWQRNNASGTAYYPL